MRKSEKRKLGREKQAQFRIQNEARSRETFARLEAQRLEEYQNILIARDKADKRKRDKREAAEVAAAKKYEAMIAESLADFKNELASES